MNTVMWDVSINMPEEKDMLFSSQGHCILMRHMVGRIKSRLSVHSPEEVARDLRLLCWLIMVNLFNCYSVITRRPHFDDFAMSSHHNLTY